MINNDDRKTLAKLEYSIDADGEIYIDIVIEDYSTPTINQFAALLASIPTVSFQLQTLGIAQEAFTRDGKIDELKYLIAEIIKKQGVLNLLEESEETDAELDDPLIKPTDLI